MSPKLARRGSWSRWRVGLLVAAVLHGGCSAGPDPVAHVGSTGVMEQPIRIALSYRANRLSATITNESDADMLVLHHPRKQPSQLELRSKGGLLRPFDTRSRKKFDATVYPADFATLTPGESMEIGDAEIERRDGDYAVQWGPFQFTELAPGSYAAKLIWVCEHSYPEDPPPTKLWLGRFESNTIDFVLE